MSSKQTQVVPNRDDASVNRMPYYVHVAGKYEPRVKALRTVNSNTGEITVSLMVPVIDGSPLLALSTLDATARRINPDARVSRYSKGPRVLVREYATA